ncbi:MAG: IS200/IS605 family transposase [Acidobacteria bacterium]|nr:IS200/IS605 family transposase [Acidobacteriota bacterium]
MPNTYTRIYIHFVFAVSGRCNLLHGDRLDDVCRYVTGIVQNQGHKLLAIGGMPDHLHVLVGLNPTGAISALARDMKSGSTRFIKEKGWFGGYAWQSGFGAFSYSRSQLDRVVRYILNQRSHHARVPFRTEYLTLLDRFDISYDEQYLFEFYD